VKKRYWLLSAVVAALGFQKLDSVLFAQPRKVIIHDDKPGAYLELALEGGWLTESQDIIVTYGYPTGLLTQDKHERLGVYTLRAPAKFVQYDDFTPEWHNPQLLIVHTQIHPDLIINLAQHQLEGAVPHVNVWQQTTTR
jgi:hypothetical protein